MIFVFLFLHILVVTGILVSFGTLLGTQKELSLPGNLAAVVALISVTVILTADESHGLILSEGHGWFMWAAAVVGTLLYVYALIIESNQRRDLRNWRSLHEQATTTLEERMKDLKPAPGGPLNGHKYIDH